MAGRPLTGLLLALTLLTSEAQGSGQSAPETREMLQVGSGALSWWGIPLYEATLLAPLGEFQAEGPYALQLTYRRNFSRSQLARATLDEIERMRGTRGDRERLISRFEALFADVTPGDQLLGVHLPGEAAVFYGPDGYLGRLDDPELASAFFEIWLAPGNRNCANACWGLRSDQA
ncbi:MAG: chalcone isomerase family protein [Candidatus Thiodiazotropha sp.]